MDKNTNPTAGAVFPAVLDATQVSEYRLCPTRFKRRFVEAIAPSQETESVDLLFGRAFAKGLEVARRAFYKDGNTQDHALEAGLSAIVDEWGDYTAPDGHVKTLECCLQALQFYVHERPFAEDYIQPYTPESMEWTGVIQLPFHHPDTNDPLLYAAKFDMLGTYGSLLMPVDEKTTTRLGATWGAQWHTRSQFLGYKHVVRTLLPNEPIGGLCVRGIAIYKREPYFKLAEELLQYNEKLVDKWYDNLLETVGRMVQNYYVGGWPLDLDAGCNAYNRRCPYSVLCETQSDRWLADFAPARRWNPLHKD